MYEDASFYINGKWEHGSGSGRITVVDPATEKVVGGVPVATLDDLDRALSASESAFPKWAATSPTERSRILRRTAGILRERADAIALLMTTEQGKPLAEAKGETIAAAETIEWFAEEGRRAYGRIVPSRLSNVSQRVELEPVGPVAAFSPWNFPVSQAARKMGASLAAGCTIIIKCPEETPRSCCALVRAFDDAGLPPGAIGLVFGVPADISEYLIRAPLIRKISFTGSVSVGKKLAELAARGMKRATMELGGHAPAIIFDDADVSAAVKHLIGMKYRNAGQVCIAPSRFYVQKRAYEQFVDEFIAASEAIKVGNGTDSSSEMGPMANSRRVEAMERLVADATDKGGRVRCGGRRIGNTGYFYEPTVLTNVTNSMAIMNEEPFGPISPIVAFDGFDDAMTEANRLPFGLASYVFTRSLSTAASATRALQAGMVSVNHFGFALPENPFGGVKDSGFGHENGTEGLYAYLNQKFVSQLNI